MTALICLNYNNGLQTTEFIKKYHSCFQMIDEIVVVDNSSTDSSYITLNQEPLPKTIIIKSDYNGGFAYGNNYGIKYALQNNPDILYFVVANSDLHLYENSLDECIRHLNDNRNIGAISPLSVTDSGKIAYDNCWFFQGYFRSFLSQSIFLSKLFRKYIFQKIDIKTMFNKCDVIQGSLVIYRKEAIVKADYFDEKTFLYSEEDIICKKLNKLGYDIGILTNCKYIHQHDSKVKKIKASQKMFSFSFKSKSYYLRKYCKTNIIKRILWLAAYPFLYIEHFLFYLLKKILRR